jgi:hypothetical protein
MTMGAASMGGHDLDGMKQPAVWRREQASEQVQAMQKQWHGNLRHSGLPAQASRLSAYCAVVQPECSLGQVRSRPVFLAFRRGIGHFFAFTSHTV